MKKNIIITRFYEGLQSVLEAALPTIFKRRSFLFGLCSIRPLSFYSLFSRKPHYEPLISIPFCLLWETTIAVS